MNYNSASNEYLTLPLLEVTHVILVMK